VDGSKFKAVNNRDKNFTRAKMERRTSRTTARSARRRHSAARASARAVRSLPFSANGQRGARFLDLKSLFVVTGAAHEQA
jgi:hypothetical protein